MGFLSDSWGLSVNHTLLLLAVILVIVDFFVSTDILSHIAYIIFSIVIARNMPFHVMYKILIALAAWFAIVACHYMFFRRFVQKAVDRVIAPDKYRSGAEGLVGMTGSIRKVEETKMIELEGDLWPIEPNEDLHPGQKVKVTKAQNGILTVESVEKE